MQIDRTVQSPNFSDVEIPVRYVVLHFTAAPLGRTLDIFTDPATEVSAHLVIDRDGAVYELVECMSGVAKRAWHAGKSRLEANGANDRRLVEGFNDFSVGIELVNLNGNVFPYTEAQYRSLFSVIESLKVSYPELARPESIVGHEHISGFRGKSDPGRLFEWARLFLVCYPEQGAPERRCLCSPEFAARLADLVRGMGISLDPNTNEPIVPESVPGQFFSLLSSLSEAALSGALGQ
jgi:N-acetylmuramoyl-L-alanine amidase